MCTGLGWAAQHHTHASPPRSQTPQYTVTRLDDGSAEVLQLVVQLPGETAHASMLLRLQSQKAAWVVAVGPGGRTAGRAGRGLRAVVLCCALVAAMLRYCHPAFSTALALLAGVEGAGELEVTVAPTAIHVRVPGRYKLVSSRHAGLRLCNACV